jgi:hypothetical protein
MDIALPRPAASVAVLAVETVAFLALFVAGPAALWWLA